MDPNSIANLVNQIAPIIIPLIANALTWLFHHTIGALSPGTKAVVNPLLPMIAAGIGTALGLVSGHGAWTGLVSGLAATGLHQLVTQPVKAARAPTK